MKKAILVLIGCYLWCAISVAEPNEYWNEVEIIGTIEPAIDDEMRFSLSGKACTTWNTDSSTICSADIKKNVKNATLKIEKRGYKILTKNFAGLQFENGMAKVNLGHVVMRKSESPEVRKIIRSIRKDKNQRFEIIFQNKKKNQYLVTYLKIMSFIPGDGMLCTCFGKTKF